MIKHWRLIKCNLNKCHAYKLRSELFSASTCSVPEWKAQSQTSKTWWNMTCFCQTQTKITTAVILLTQGAGNAGRIQTFASKRLWKVKDKPLSLQLIQRSQKNFNDQVKSIYWFSFRGPQYELKIFIEKQINRERSNWSIPCCRLKHLNSRQSIAYLTVFGL